MIPETTAYHTVVIVVTIKLLMQSKYVNEKKNFDRKRRVMIGVLYNAECMKEIAMIHRHIKFKQTTMRKHTQKHKNAYGPFSE